MGSREHEHEERKLLLLMCKFYVANACGKQTIKGKEDVSNKRKALFFLILAILMILFFTLQEPEKSRDLSETIRIWLGSIGIDVDYKELRSNIHILEYLVVGLAACGFCRSRGWRLWIGVAIGCGIGVIDGGIKVLLPGREFSSGDLIRDFFGVAVAVCCVEAFKLIKLLISWEKTR